MPVATPFGGSDLSQSVSWIREPRTGLGYSITIAWEVGRNDSVVVHNARATAKLGYAFW
jgi:hypothetical protein